MNAPTSTDNTSTPPQKRSLLVHILYVVLMLLAFAAVSQLGAATFVWNNSGTDWSTSTDWTPSGPPTSTDIASFDTSVVGNTLQNPVVSGSNLASGLNLNNNFQGGTYSFSGSGTLTLGSGGIVVRGVGTQTISGPTLAGAAAGNLTFNVGNGAGLTLAGTTTATTNSAAVNANGGTFTVDNSTNTSAKLNGNAIKLNGGGTLALIGNSAGTTLNLGALTTTDNGLGGNNTIRVTPNGASTLINFTGTSVVASLRGGTRMTWDFQAASGNLGDANGAKITFATPPSLGTAGLFANTVGGATVGFATVTDGLGKNFATYNTVGSTALGIVSIANSGQAIASVTTVTTSTGLTGLTSSSNGQYNAPTGATTSSAITAATLRITPANGASLSMGTSNITVSALMLDGTNDFSITGTTPGSIGTGTRYFYVNNAATTLTTNLQFTTGTNAVVFAGPGTVALSGTGLQNNGTSANNYRISLTGGVLRGNNAQLELTSAATRGVFNLYGGVLEITNGVNGTGTSADFSRSLGTTAGNVNWGFGSSDTGSGGFSAFGAAASVNIGGSATAATLTWNSTTSFVGDGYALKFGSTKSDNTLTFLNPLALDGGSAGTYAAREINVTKGTGVAADKTILSGVLSGSSSTDLLKTGTGTLQLATGNTYNGHTLITGGLIAGSGESMFGTNPAAAVADQIILSGGGIQATGAITFSSNRGVTLGANGGTIDTNGNSVSFSGANNIISGPGALTKSGSGALTLSVANTYSGGSSVTAGTLQLGNNGTTGDAGSGDIAVSTGATLKTSRSNTLSLGQAITGAGNLDVSNTSAGTTILSKATGNTYSGTTTVSGGTLLANNTSGSATGSSTVSVNGATAVLGGTGTIGGATTVTLGQITPGTAAITGKLTFGNAVTLDGTSAGTRLSLRLGASGATDLNDAANIQAHLSDNTYLTWILTQASAYELTTGGTHDRLSVDTLNLSSGGRIVVDSTAGYSPQFGDVFNLLDWTTFNKNSFSLGTDANNQRAGGLIGDLNLPGLASGLTYDLSLFSATGASGIVIVVPEPSRAVLFILGVITMTLRRRRR